MFELRQHMHFNILDIVESNHELMGCYEYTPQGERTVFLTSEVNDFNVHAANNLSRCWLRFRRL